MDPTGHQGTSQQYRLFPFHLVLLVAEGGRVMPFSQYFLISWTNTDRCNYSKNTASITLRIGSQMKINFIFLPIRISWLCGISPSKPLLATKIKDACIFFGCAEENLQLLLLYRSEYLSPNITLNENSFTYHHWEILPLLHSHTFSSMRWPDYSPVFLKAVSTPDRSFSQKE